MPTSDDLPFGQRFSHVYLERGAAIDDSPRLRRPLAAYLSDVFLAQVAPNITNDSHGKFEEK